VAKRTIPGHVSIEKMREEWRQRRIHELEQELKTITEERDRLREKLRLLGERASRLRSSE
jgi:uncharacterized coiled-coil DUF342 family protein